MPTATANENSTASMNDRPNSRFTTKIVTLSTTPTRASSPEKLGEPQLELGLGVPLAEANRDPAELGEPSGGDHDGVSRALVHDGAHEQA